MDRMELLKQKIEIDGFQAEFGRFKAFIDKISQQSFDYILNNFEFIGFHKNGIVPDDKKSLTFTYGSNQIANTKFAVEIGLKNYSFFSDMYCPVNNDKLAIKFYNNYGIVAIADINGNLYCNDLFHYSTDSTCNCHLLFDNLIDKYKTISFPIASLAETLLAKKLSTMKSIVKDISIEMKVKKTIVDKKTALNLLKYELLAIETSIKAHYETLLIEKDKQIEQLQKTIDTIKENAFSITMEIVSRLIQNNFKLEFDNNKILIDCSGIKVNKLKKDNRVYNLPPDCQKFKIGTIILPYSAKTLGECRIVPGTSFHPNISSTRPCFGDNLYKLTDIVEAIKLLQTVNLDGAHDNEATNIAVEIYKNKLAISEPIEHVWVS